MSTRAPKVYRVGRRRQRGAALLILLTMLLLGMAAVFVNSFRNNSLGREALALQVMGETREALIGYAVLHGRLPRPSANSASGLEDVNACVSEKQCTGYLPWATLGLAPTYARGKPLRYSVTPAFSFPSTRLRYAIPTKTVSGREGSRLVEVEGRLPCALTVPCSPAVIIASGKYQGRGGIDQQANDDAVANFIKRAASDQDQKDGGAFDDLVLWISYDQLMRRASVSGGLEGSR